MHPRRPVRALPGVLVAAALLMGGVALAAPSYAGGAALQLTVVAGDPVDADGDATLGAGDTISFTFTLTDVGTEAVSALTVDDPVTGPPSCPPTPALAAGASLTCTVTYTLTADDVRARVLRTTAVAHGTDPAGGAVVSNGASTSSRLTGVAALRLTKHAEAPVDANQTGRIDAGDPVTFVYTVANVGDLVVHGLTIDDAGAMGAGCAEPELAPGASTTCSGSHVISQSDVDGGQLQTLARARALTPRGSVVASPDATTTTTIEAAPEVSLALSARLDDSDGDGVADAGERILYTFVITDTGTSTLRDLAISDDLLRAAGAGITCPTTSLASGASVTCSATYTVTDVDLGRPLVNRAVVSAAGSPTVSSAPVSVTVPTGGVVAATPAGTTAHHGRWPTVALLAGLLVLGAAGGSAALVVRRRRARAASHRPPTA